MQAFLHIYVERTCQDIRNACEAHICVQRWMLIFTECLMRPTFMRYTVMSRRGSVPEMLDRVGMCVLNYMLFQKVFNSTSIEKRCWQISQISQISQIAYNVAVNKG